jgi:hypothetical protein
MPLANTVADIEKDEVDIRLRVDEKGDAHGSFTVLLRGRDAQHLSEALFRLVGQERERALRTVVLAWLPEANVDSVSLSSSEGSWQVALRSEVSLVGFAGFETAKVGSSERTGAIPGLDPLHRAVQGLGAMTFGASYLRQADRDSALAIHHATNYHVRRRVELPAGVRVLRTPGPFMLEQAPFRAERNLLWSKSGTGGPILEEDFRLDVATGTVETSQYPAFVRHARSIDAAFLASTRLGFHVVKAP